MVAWDPYVPAVKPKRFDLTTTEGYNLFIQWALTEKTFQQQFLTEAALHGWGPWYHTQWSLGSTKGFPDLVGLNPRTGRTVFIELKRMAGSPSPAQIVWLSALRTCGNEVYLFRPDDQSEITRVLQSSTRAD